MERAGRATIGWAGSALVLTTIVAIAAKIAGVIVAPGARGVAGEAAVNLLDTLSGTLAYTLTALLVALVCGGSFELARARNVNVVARGAVVAVSGLIVALASPAVLERLNTLPSLALAVVTSLVALASGLVVLRSAPTRAVGAVLSLLAVCALLRVTAWETAAVAADHGSMSLLDVARAFATAAIVVQAFAVLAAAAWIGTRSKWRGRILANLAIAVAFLLTYLGARTSDAPNVLEAILRTSLPAAIGMPAPFAVGAVAAFLVPASILLAIVALTERAQPAAVTTTLALALLSHGAFDVPLHALLLTASAEWALLAMTDERAHWLMLLKKRDAERVEQAA